MSNIKELLISLGKEVDSLVDFLNNKEAEHQVCVKDYNKFVSMVYTMMKSVNHTWNGKNRTPTIEEIDNTIRRLALNMVEGENLKGTGAGGIYINKDDFSGLYYISYERRVLFNFDFIKSLSNFKE